MAQAAGGALMEFFTAPRSKYTVFGEAIRYVVPSHVQCSYGCGGQACKYDNPTYWRDDQQAIKGLYSSWVTDHILACSRPSTEIIEKYNIIDQFKRNGIKTLINLQIPGEHAYCGNPLEETSGFSYCPEVFMENNIYFYNFGWSDYGVGSLTAVLDLVKVMAFALQEGRVAIHCHAGLGRTGVLIACFITFTTRMTANQAILYVRSKRLNSIQTRSQLRCVRQFVQFLVPLRSVFSCAKPLTYPVTLTQYLQRQSHMLHGYERRQMRYLPKIIQLVCKLLIDIAENREVIEEDILEAPDSEDLEMEQSIIEKLGPEIFINQPRLPGTPTLPRHFNEPPIFYHRKSLSYSESDLRRLRSDLNLLTQPFSSLSQDTVRMSESPTKKQWNSNVSLTSFGSTNSLWDIKNLEHQKDGSILIRRDNKTSIQRSESMGNSTDKKKGGLLTRLKVEERKELAINGRKADSKEEEVSEVPFITLQSELSLDSRRLLVAQALAVDLFLDGEEEHKRKVLDWEAELNQGGAWERLCLEQDPFILTGLMWAWLEQLREPVISAEVAREVAQDLDPKNKNPKTALSPLDQGARETLVCILDCMAHMQFVPEQVENAFLNRTIKAFTRIQDDTPEGSELYTSLSKILLRVVDEKRNSLIVLEYPRKTN